MSQSPYHGKPDADKRRRARGWLFLITFYESEHADAPVRGGIVTRDWLTAVLCAAGGDPALCDIGFAAPGQGLRLRRFLETGENTGGYPLATVAPITRDVMRGANVSRAVALWAVKGVIEDRGGHGAECLRWLGARFNPRWAGGQSDN